MEYEYHFFKRTDAKLIEFLNEHKIEFKEKVFNQSWVEFSICTSSPTAELHLQELKRMNVEQNYITVKFTSKELLAAELLMMRPKRQSIDIENEDAFHYTCKWFSRNGTEYMRHEEQVKDLVVKKIPSMKKKTAFWCESTGFSLIFADKRICELVENNSLVGIMFKKVFLKNGKYSENFFQMNTTNILKKQCIVWGHGEKVENCPKCGKEQYVIGNVWQLHLDFSKIETQSDMYMTERIFGGGIAEPIYVISQKFYRLLLENKLDGNVTFYPVVKVLT